MENNPRKSKAVIITIVAIIVLLLSMYLLFKNKDVFGVKTSATIAKIFSPLAPSDNSKDLTPITSNNSLWDSVSGFLGNLFGNGEKTPKYQPADWKFDSSSNTWTLPDGSTFNADTKTWKLAEGSSFNADTGIWSLSDGSTFDINTGIWTMPDSSTFNSKTKIWNMADGSTFDKNTNIWIFPDGSTFNVGTGIWTFPDGSTFDINTGKFTPSATATFNATTGIWTLSDGSTFNSVTGIWTSPIGSTFNTHTGAWTSADGNSWFDSNTLTWHFAGGSTFNSGTGVWTSADGHSWFDSDTVTWHFADGSTFNSGTGIWTTPEDITFNSNTGEFTPPDGSCPENWTGTYPTCTPPTGINTCPTNWNGTYPVCTPPFVPGSCPANWTGTYPVCQPPFVPGSCPANWTGTYPVCTPPPGGPGVCPTDWTGTYPICTPPFIDGTCPPDWGGTYPVCYPPYELGDCPTNWTGTYPSCTPPGGGGGGDIPPTPLPDLIVGTVIPILGELPKNDTVFSPIAPIVTTIAPFSITKTTAMGGGNVISDGSSPVKVSGIVWGTTASPTIALSTKTTNGWASPGNWTSNISGLTNNKTYHVRAYATNNIGTSYGNDMVFTTIADLSANVIPTVISPTSTTTSNSTLFRANITSLGVPATISAHGICYNTTGNPTLSNAFCTASTSPQTTGQYALEISGIPPSSTYKFVGYATNATGTGYTPEGTFTTGAVSGNTPTVTSPTATSISFATAILGANVTSAGTSAITARGTCWATTTNPTTNCSTVTGTTGVFTGRSSGAMPSDTLIYYRGYAKNSSGTAYSTSKSFITSAVNSCTSYTIPLTSCFTADTLVELANGTTKNIQDVKVGDILKGEKTNNKVLGLHRPDLNGKLYSFNGGRYFVTEEHPFKTTDGWKSINPEKTKLENIGITVTTLKVGDTLITENGKVLLRTIDSKEGKDNTELFNFILDGDHTYYADGYLVHNKKACDLNNSCATGSICVGGQCETCGSCSSGYTASCTSSGTFCSCDGSGGGGGGISLGTCVSISGGSADNMTCALKKTKAGCDLSSKTCIWLESTLQ